jgi:hypothetical protein
VLAFIDPVLGMKNSIFVKTIQIRFKNLFCKM